MPRIASDKLILAALALLTVGSVGLKGAAGPPADASTAAPDQLDLRLARTLQAQGFATTVHPYPNRSPAVLATRGQCRLSVRDAANAASDAAIFAVDAASIGPVRYLFQGRQSKEPPAVAMRIARLNAELRWKLGLGGTAPVPLGLAASPGCGSSDFGLANLSV